MLPTRDSPQIKRNTQTESKGMEKGIPCKWKLKESQSSNTYMRQNRLQNKDCYKRQRRTLHNEQGINPRRYNNCKYIAPNIEALKYIRQILTDIKGEINSNTITVEDFNTTLTSMDRSSRQKINKETLALNYTLDQMDLIDIYRAFISKQQNNT